MKAVCAFTGQPPSRLETSSGFERRREKKNRDSPATDPRGGEATMEGEPWPGRGFTRSTHKLLKIRTESIARLPAKLVL